MPVNMKAETSRTHPRESSFLSIMSGWAEQGVQSIFATQRILLDLAMRQNENVMQAFREQLNDPDYCPTAIISEAAGDGITNFIAGQKLLLDLGKQQHDILMEGIKERVGGWPAAQAMTSLLQRSVETFIHMQEEFLDIARKQTHKLGGSGEGRQTVRVRTSGDPGPRGSGELHEDAEALPGRDLRGNRQVQRWQGRRRGARKMKKTELAELARQATESFIEAQKNLIDLTGKQVNANVKTAGKAVKLLRPFPFVPFADMTREGVKSYVDAQKALMNKVVKPAAEHKAAKHAQRRKRPRTRAKAMVAIA